jgi:tetratricopeptide (TPR) repeat protein
VVVEFPLGSSKARRLWLLGTLIVSALLIEQAAWIWRANTDLDTRDLNSIERGTRLLPGDADAWDRLGRFRQWNFANPDPAGAVRDYQKAVHDLPLSPYYWIDLATAYEQTGRLDMASQAFQHAEAAYPISAGVAWQYGNFLLRERQVSKGLEEIHRAVESDPSLIPLAMSRVWTATHDVQAILDRVLPANAGAYFQALDFFQSIQGPDSGLVVWKRLLSLGQPFSLRNAFPFLDELISADRAADAEKVWLGAVRASGIPLPLRSDSLIWNGEFTQPFANGGLGWCWDAPLGVAIDFDDPRVAGPGRSVRLDFGGGNNTDLDAPFQYVPVEPNTAYHFRAYLKTQAITTESGVRFAITDANHPGAVGVVTENLTGTHPWTPADAEFTTGPQTHFLVVRLSRPPSRLFDNQLSGTAWIAEVSLVRSQPGRGQTTP